jgi:pimeloyl-ACP methyl ester carboxylesterase
VVLVSSVAPLDDLTFPDDPGERELIELARRDPDRAAAMITEAAGWLGILTASWRCPDPNRTPGCCNRSRRRPCRIGGPGSGSAGAERLRDRRGACRRPWGISLDQVACEDSIWHGAHDLVVPPAQGSALAQLLSHARLQIDPEHGHGLILARWADIGADALPNPTLTRRLGQPRRVSASLLSRRNPLLGSGAIGGPKPSVLLLSEWTGISP